MGELFEARGAKLAAITAGAVVASVLLFLYVSSSLFQLMIGRGEDSVKLLGIYQYWFYYGHIPAIKFKLFLSAAGGAGAVAAVAAILLTGRRPAQHGDAQFASFNEVSKAGLMQEYGIILGKMRGKFIVLAHSLHATIRAKTRGGKGVGIAVPNMMAWAGSAVANDPKGELYDITSKHRAQYGQKVYLFNPLARDRKTHRWNPLAYISEDPAFRIDDIQKIAGYLFPNAPNVDPIWPASARSLMLGAILYMLETPGYMVTFGELYRLVTQGEECGAFFSRVIEERATTDNPLSSECVAALNDFIQTSTNTRTSIRKTFTSKFELFLNPLLDAATAGNDFDFRRLRKEKITIYVAIEPSNLERMGPLLNLFWQQLTDLNTDKLPEQDPSIRERVLLLGDEFASMGKVPALAHGSTYLAGYWLQLLPIFQNDAQAIEIYGVNGAKTLDGNMGARVYFAPSQDDNEQAEKISLALGTQTWKVRTLSNPRSWFTAGKHSENVSEQGRRLMLPQEVKAIGPRKEFIFIDDVNPILAEKIRYYDEPVFMAPLRSLSPTLDAVGYRLGLKFLGRRATPEKVMKDAMRLGELRLPVPEISLIPRSMRVGAAKIPTEKDVEAKAEMKTVERPLEVKDLGNLPNMPLESFSCDFSDIRLISENETLSDEEMKQGCDAVLEAYGWA